MSYYAVVNGRIPGIYEDWHECQNQVHRFGYHKFKRFNTRRDAGDYMREYYDSDYESHYEFYDPDPLEMHIYTDGACRNNHLVMYGGSEAGYGVYFGRNDHRNQSGRVPGNQTNQSAELYAIYRALEYYFQDVTNGNEVYNIYTDSRYSINALTKWYRSWEKNGWVTLQGREMLQINKLSESVEI